MKSLLRSPKILDLTELDIIELFESGEIDTYLVSTEDGFSPLGMAREFLAKDLGWSQEEIKKLADWNRFHNERITLVALKSLNPMSKLRGLILCPCENSKCYKAFATPLYGKPSRDFYYNVTYEAIAYATKNWQSQKLAISHLTASNHFHKYVANCTVEGLVHFYKEWTTTAIESLAFIGCCIGKEHLIELEKLVHEAMKTNHRVIQIDYGQRDEAILINLNLDQNLK
jgi:hypothetical protein